MLALTFALAGLGGCGGGGGMGDDGGTGPFHAPERVWPWEQWCREDLDYGLDEKLHAYTTTQTGSALIP